MSQLISSVLQCNRSLSILKGIFIKSCFLQQNKYEFNQKVVIFREFIGESGLSGSFKAFMLILRAYRGSPGFGPRDAGLLRCTRNDKITISMQ